jgi:hypothetical protein
MLKCDIPVAPLNYKTRLKNIFSMDYLLRIRTSPKPFSYLLGKFISSMSIGQAIVAVPAGIFTVERMKSTLTEKKCAKCSRENEISANYCSNCGHSFIL